MHEPSTPTLSVLTRGECLTLLATVPIGRVVFTENALPAVRPVNFILNGDEIVIRTGEGGKLLAALHHSVVAFEVDEVDQFARTGWSVTAIGHAREVVDPAELALLRKLPLATWAPLQYDHLVCITAELVSGRRLEHMLPAQKLA
ncbi:MAG TPA: pyridoxamine 5'-phosphate oxidase family protein [Streptosporangiaceae bacterium]|nr:pyridoxamine 5'-phosphate oxidase family protein [Streptosporangiaceae bacterium]